MRFSPLGELTGRFVVFSCQKIPHLFAVTREVVACHAQCLQQLRDWRGWAPFPGGRSHGIELLLLGDEEEQKL